MAQSPDSPTPPALSLRQSIAPRVLDNSLPMGTLVSTNKFSVRVASPDTIQCASSSSSILTTFLWRDPGVSVLLAGSFDDWRKHQMMYVPEVRYHILVTELPPGEYYYRFVVDGRWRVADGDPNLTEDPFGQVSHYISISPQSVASATANSKRFSTAAISHAQLTSHSHDTMHDHGDSDTECEEEDEEHDDDDEASSAPISPDMQSETDHSRQQHESVRLSRKRGSTYIGDYDDDQYAGLDLQQDVFEAMKDVAEVNTDPRAREPSPTRSPVQETSVPRRVRRRPGVRMLRKVWGLLFGESGGDENESPNHHQQQQRTDSGGPSERMSRPTHNQKVHGLVTHENALKKGLKVWFPNERNFPAKAGAGRKVAPEEKVEVVDAGDRALKLHQVEENANNRQMLGKNLFAQGKYDAALALFSLSVKLREDNGLKYAKTTAIAHTDVASAFIHLDDLKNAEKHLLKALAIYNKGTFSGGKAQLGDVHCFLGVIGDMRGDLKAAEKSYRAAIDLYEKCKATTDNPNHATAIENLNANLRRQRTVGAQGTSTVTIEKAAPTQATKPTQASNRNKNTLQHQKSHTLKKPHVGNHLQSQRALHPEQASQQNAVTMGSQENYQFHSGRTEPGGVHSTQGGTTPTPLAPSRRPPLLDSATRDSTPQMGHAQHHQPHVEQMHQSSTFHRSGLSSPAMTIGTTAGQPLEEASLTNQQRQSKSKPNTWKGLADTARASMPQHPPVEPGQTGYESVDDTNPPAGSYEEMCRMWHKDARVLLGQGKYKEAIDLYTLVVYTRKRHGPWTTRRNVDSLVEFARALFAARDLDEAVKTLRDAIDILEKLDNDDDKFSLGEVWGNLGSVLDRIKTRPDEALSAHCAGMVAYGKSGMSSEDAKWKKAWKGLCMHLKMSGRLDQAEEIWHSVDLQIRGIAPMTKVSNVVLR